MSPSILLKILLQTTGKARFYSELSRVFVTLDSQKNDQQTPLAQRREERQSFDCRGYPRRLRSVGLVICALSFILSVSSPLSYHKFEPLDWAYTTQTPNSLTVVRDARLGVHVLTPVSYLSNLGRPRGLWGGIPYTLPKPKNLPVLSLHTLTSVPLSLT